MHVIAMEVAIAEQRKGLMVLVALIDSNAFNSNEYAMIMNKITHTDAIDAILWAQINIAEELLYRGAPLSDIRGILESAGLLN